MQKRHASRLIKLSLAGIFAAFCGNSYASAFQLFELNGAGAGNYYAGGAAIANDASTAYFNPAGLVLIPNQQLVVSAVNIFSNVSFSGSDIWTTTTPQFVGESYTQTGTAQGGSYNFVPSLDYAAPINDAVAFGFSVGVPFGLDTEYGDNSFVSYSATETSVQVVDLSPSLGFKLTNNFSLGAGVDAEHIDAVFNSIGALPPLAVAQTGDPSAYDTSSDNNASGWGYGWHAGALYQFTPDTRVGLAYHSKVTFTVNGTSDFSGPLAGGPQSTVYGPNSNAQFSNDALTATTTLPATTMLSIFHQINDAWSVMATAAYTQWSVFNQLTLENVQAVNAALGPEQIDVVVPQGFRNSWRFAAGANYQLCADWQFTGGLGYDESPTVDQYRNIRLPDGNRVAAALGVHYQATKTVGLDVGWTHLFFQNGEVNVTQTQGSQQTTTIGTAKTSADILGAQLTWNIV